jgi:ribose 1,5-bisphosphokinase
MINHRLLYFVGPSGAGKDTLINRLRQTPHFSSEIYFVKRLVDRPAHESTLLDEYLSSSDFAKALDHQELAMHWVANEHQYGIRVSELIQAASYPISVINGSRAYAFELKNKYPHAEIIHITASELTIKDRLQNRQRENNFEIDKRIKRTHELSAHRDHYSFEILNDHSLDTAFSQLVQFIETKK